MNHLPETKHLKNTYYVMRHGQSKANLAGIIVSDPVNGVHDDYSLTDLGKEQAYTSARGSELTKDVIIYASDFSRALQTAEIVREVVGAEKVIPTSKLRERYFGDYEKQDHKHYQDVWDIDATNPHHTEKFVESAASVLDRATRFINELEEEYTDKQILLVAHGDVLQILQVGFEHIDPSLHRTLTHLETAEIRRMT